MSLYSKEGWGHGRQKLAKGTRQREGIKGKGFNWICNIQNIFYIPD